MPETFEAVHLQPPFPIMGLEFHTEGAGGEPRLLVRLFLPAATGSPHSVLA